MADTEVSNQDIQQSALAKYLYGFSSVRTKMEVTRAKRALRILVFNKVRFLVKLK